MMQYTGILLPTQAVFMTKCCMLILVKLGPAEAQHNFETSWYRLWCFDLMSANLSLPSLHYTGSWLSKGHETAISVDVKRLPLTLTMPA